MPLNQGLESQLGDLAADRSKTAPTIARPKARGSLRHVKSVLSWRRAAPSFVVITALVLSPHSLRVDASNVTAGGMWLQLSDNGPLSVVSCPLGVQYGGPPAQPLQTT